MSQAYQDHCNANYGPEDEPENDCDHTDYEPDILTGIASCDRCGYRWMQSFEEIEAEHRRISAYQQFEDRENRQQRRQEFWRKITLPIRWPIFRLLEIARPRKSLSVLTDDEIPF